MGVPATPAPYDWESEGVFVDRLQYDWALEAMVADYHRVSAWLQRVCAAAALPVPTLSIDYEDASLNATAYIKERRVTITRGMLSRPQGEVEWVLAHEMGHLRDRRRIKLADRAITSTSLVTISAGCALVVGPTVAAVGMAYGLALASAGINWAIRKKPGVLAEAVGLALDVVWSPLTIAQAAVRRRFEQRADAFALEVTKSPHDGISFRYADDRQRAGFTPPESGSTPRWRARLQERIAPTHPTNAKRRNAIRGLR